jgi:prepilin-type N-terminal cleavage/methylation domain-containing protein
MRRLRDSFRRPALWQAGSASCEGRRAGGTVCGGRSGRISRRPWNSGSSRREAGRTGRSSAGFTLLEILLSLAIIALLAAVLIGGSAALLNDRPVSPEEIFWQAVQEARKTALKNAREVRLKYDGEAGAFVIVDGRAPATLAADGFTLEEVPLRRLEVPERDDTELRVDFLGTAKGGNMILVGGVLLEAQPIPFVTFFGDGTCTPFRVQFARSGSANTLSIDPWTCAPVLEKRESL